MLVYQRVINQMLCDFILILESLEPQLLKHHL